MISIVDATELRFVLRPTVYRPPIEPAERAVTVRRALDGSAADDGSFGAETPGASVKETIAR